MARWWEGEERGRFGGRGWEPWEGRFEHERWPRHEAEGRYGYGGAGRYGGWGGDYERGYGERGYGERDYGPGGLRFGGGSEPWWARERYGERGRWGGGWGEEWRSEGEPWERGQGEEWRRFGHEERGRIERLGDRLRQGLGRLGRGPKGYRRSDERIQDEVCERIARSGVDADEVEVRVNEGEVTLTGRVEERWQKRRLEDVVDDVFGVQEVHNQLRVGRGAEAQSFTATPPGQTEAQTGRRRA
jgi:HSP20 family molecular chaperone IbpA